MILDLTRNQYSLSLSLFNSLLTCSYSQHHKLSFFLNAWENSQKNWSILLLKLVCLSELNAHLDMATKSNLTRVYTAGLTDWSKLCRWAGMQEKWNPTRKKRWEDKWKNKLKQRQSLSHGSLRFSHCIVLTSTINLWLSQQQIPGSGNVFSNFGQGLSTL